MKTLLRILAGIVGFVLLVIVAGLIYFWPKSSAGSSDVPQASLATTQTSDPPKATYIGLGDTGIVRTGVPAGVTKDAQDEVMKAVTAKDREGIAELINRGDAIYVDNNTKVRVVETGFLQKRIRLLSGDHKGKAVWVPSELVEAL